MKVYILFDTDLGSVIGVFYTELQAQERRVRYFHPNPVGKSEKNQTPIWEETVY